MSFNQVATSCAICEKPFFRDKMKATKYCSDFCRAEGKREKNRKFNARKSYYEKSIPEARDTHCGYRQDEFLSTKEAAVFREAADAFWAKRGMKTPYADHRIIDADFWIYAKDHNKN